jgi:serine protease Do
MMMKTTVVRRPWSVVSCVLPILALWQVATIRWLSAAEDRREKVLKDRTELQSMPQWIYNDLAKGFAEAKRTGKPMLVVLRCIP